MVNGIPNDKIPVYDRGLAYGDGFFETLYWHQGQLQNWNYHWKRMQRSALVFQLKLPVEEDLIEDVAALNLSPENDCVVKMIITRGTGGRGYSPANCTSTVRIVSCSALPDYSQHKVDGISITLLNTVLGSQPMLAGLKHLNRLNQVFARIELEKTSYFEGLVCNQDGHVREVIASNIFIVRKGKIITPPLTDCGVEGTVRAKIIHLFENSNTPIIIDNFTPNELLLADEIFITNSLLGVCPVINVSGSSFPIGEQTRRISDMKPEFN